MRARTPEQTLARRLQVQERAQAQDQERGRAQGLKVRRGCMHRPNPSTTIHIVPMTPPLPLSGEGRLPFFHFDFFYLSFSSILFGVTM